MSFKNNIVSDLILNDYLLKRYKILLDDVDKKYLCKKYLNYLNFIYNDYEDIKKDLDNIIKYKNKYNLLLNQKCSLCYRKLNYINNNTSNTSNTSNTYNTSNISNNNYILYKFYHSIKYLEYIDNYGYLIYIEPQKALDTNIYFVCQHLLMVIDYVINLHFNNNNNNREFKIVFVFNMINSSNTINNIRIAQEMYNILNNCYINIIKNIYVINLGALISFFTKLFSKHFNNKIINTNKLPFKINL